MIFIIIDIIEIFSDISVIIFILKGITNYEKSKNLICIVIFIIIVTIRSLFPF